MQYMANSKRTAYDRAVSVLCPIIESQLDSRCHVVWSEQKLRTELVACILGSQVRQEMASSALDRLEGAGLLGNDWWNKDKSGYKFAVFEVLSGRYDGESGRYSYRFPMARAKQLAGAREAVVRIPLQQRLATSLRAKQLRQHLVDEIPGLGPKQASMFLRNIGWSYDLAILDTHVLRFLDMHLILPVKPKSIGSIRSYERVERTFVEYADSLGYPVGYLDWAIWVTMRAARELRI